MFKCVYKADQIDSTEQIIPQDIYDRQVNQGTLLD